MEKLLIGKKAKLEQEICAPLCQAELVALSGGSSLPLFSSELPFPKENTYCSFTYLTF